MEKKEMKSIIEGLLFAWGEPLNIKEIGKVLEIDSKEIYKILEEMKSEFDYNRRGVQILKFGNNYQLGTRIEHNHYISKLYEKKEKKTISNAALETVTIIAYKQPITKIEIEELRGVKSDKAIQTLIEKDLIEERGRLDKIGKPIVYGTTNKFLKSFGLKDIKELPKPEELETLKEKNIEENL